MMMMIMIISDGGFAILRARDVVRGKRSGIHIAASKRHFFAMAGIGMLAVFSILFMCKAFEKKTTVGGRGLLAFSRALLVGD